MTSSESILPGSGIDVTGLDPAMVARGRSVKCRRCGESPVEKPSVDGATLVNYYTPATGVRSRGVLCGDCSFGLVEYMDPAALDDAEYASMKADILAAWAGRR